MQMSKEESWTRKDRTYENSICSRLDTGERKRTVLDCSGNSSGEIRMFGKKDNSHRRNIGRRSAWRDSFH